MTIIRVLLILLVSCAAVTTDEVVAEPDTVTISGRVTDFSGSPLAAADVAFLDNGFNPLASVSTDQNGGYTLEVVRGSHGNVFACKDYREKNLEYWAWSVLATEDLTINARVHRLELYAMNAFVPQGASPSWLVFFRPMSLTKAISSMEKMQDPKEHESMRSVGVLDIAPSLEPGEIKATVDGVAVSVLEINQVREAGGEGTLGLPLVAYLIQIAAPEDGPPGSNSRRICVELHDAEQKESGEACVFWRPATF